MEGPASSYSCLLIHICWKVEREARMEPPIQTEYFLSGGAMIWRGTGTGESQFFSNLHGSYGEATHHQCDLYLRFMGRYHSWLG